MGQLFVSPTDKGWKVKNTDNSKASGLYDTKAEAKAAATAIAKNQGLELVIQNLDGTISEKNSFGNDPKGIKG